MNSQFYYIFIGLIFLSFTSFDTNDCVSEIFSKTDKKLKKKYEKNVTHDKDGIRHLIDSINYYIIRRWKDDMTPIIESISNNLTKIEFWKDYYDNGQLKEVGYMTIPHGTNIGKWEYYSKTGKLDSIVDYDKEYKVPFCHFYQIAEERGLTGKTSQILFNIETRKWRVEKWEYGKDHATATGIELQVDSMTINEIKNRGIY